MRLVFCIAGRAPNDLDDFGKAGPITHGQSVFAPNPVKAFLGHSQRDDDVHVSHGLS